MDEMKWHEGPPPHVGWWNASGSYDDLCWRWWNGNEWSQPAWPSTNAYHASERANQKRTMRYLIRWRHYYPENARVPRVAP